MLNHHVLAEVAYDSGARTYAVDFPDRQPWSPSGFSFQVCAAYRQVVSCEDSVDATIPSDERIREMLNEQIEIWHRDWQCGLRVKKCVRNRGFSRIDL